MLDAINLSKELITNDNKKFISYCALSQKRLKTKLSKELLSLGYNVKNESGFLFAEGEIPILLVAHLDTVHKQQIKQVWEYTKNNGQHWVTSPQGIGGDDRCGIYIIMKLIAELKCSVLFCEDEEIGGIGAGKFCLSDNVETASKNNFIIEFDRKGKDDSVYYDCNNIDFESFINSTGKYRTSWGSFSDISTLAPILGIAAVNLSCGYYNAHSISEYVILEELESCIERAKKIILDGKERYEYVELKKINQYDYYDECHWSYGGMRTMEIFYKTNEGLLMSELSKGYDNQNCLYNFLVKHYDIPFSQICDYYMVG